MSISKLLFIVSFLYISGCKQPAGKTTASGFVPIAGSKIYYETTGKGEPLLMLHGGFLNMHMWDQQIADLSKDHLVITCDLRGHGSSIDDTTDYIMADGLKALLDTLHVKQASVIGLSVGGACALDFAIRYPDQVKKLILLGPGVYKGPANYTRDTVDLKYDSLMKDALEIRKDTNLVAEYFIRCWFDGPQRTPQQTDTAQRAKALAMAIENMKRHQLKYWPKFQDTPTLSRVGELKMPVRVMVGELDNLVIKIIADSLKAGVKDIRVTTINGTAHMPNMEKPMVVNKLIRDWLIP